MPITGKRHNEEATDDQANEEHRYTSFVYTSRWFVASQTVGDDLTPPALDQWEESAALEALDIQQIPFTETDGNCQGYARKRHVAINPVAQLPHKTLFHEIAHLCRLRSYVLLISEVVLNEASHASVPDITFFPDSVRAHILVVAFLSSLSLTIEE
jgi:hypothetical protein